MEESVLIRSCRLGDRESCRELLEKYRDYAMAVSLHILMNRQDAEDACQEAFFKAFRFLEDPAVRAVRQWKYEPYLKDGKAVEAVFSVVLRWGRSPKGHP